MRRLINSDKRYNEAETCQCCINSSIVALFYPYPVTGHFLLPQISFGIKWMEWDNIFFRYNSVSQEGKLKFGTPQDLTGYLSLVHAKMYDLHRHFFFQQRERSDCYWMHSSVGRTDIFCPFGIAFLSFVFKC